MLHSIPVHQDGVIPNFSYTSAQWCSCRVAQTKLAQCSVELSTVRFYVTMCYCSMKIIVLVKQKHVKTVLRLSRVNFFLGTLSKT